jgi:hypothetical protein
MHMAGVTTSNSPGDTREEYSMTKHLAHVISVVNLYSTLENVLMLISKFMYEIQF